MIGYIYTLHWDNNENDIFYVGATINPKGRENGHRTTYPFYGTGSRPTLLVVEEITFQVKTELFEIERYWIQQFRAWGYNLINLQLGYGFNLQHRLLMREIERECMEELRKKIDIFPPALDKNTSKKLIYALENYKKL